jgi:hypothetical protein
MLMKTSRFVRFWISCFSLSTSVPFRPMMIPGPRGIDVDLQLVRGASVSIFETPACAKRFFSV